VTAPAPGEVDDRAKPSDGARFEVPAPSLVADRNSLFLPSAVLKPSTCGFLVNSGSSGGLESRSPIDSLNAPALSVPHLANADGLTALLHLNPCAVENTTNDHSHSLTPPRANNSRL
jgi:hypothetical protein